MKRECIGCELQCAVNDTIEAMTNERAAAGSPEAEAGFGAQIAEFDAKGTDAAFWANQTPETTVAAQQAGEEYRDALRKLPDAYAQQDQLSILDARIVQARELQGVLSINEKYCPGPKRRLMGFIALGMGSWRCGSVAAPYVRKRLRDI